MKHYSAIILAAGFSSRMGSFKPLIDLLGKTPLERCIDLFKCCGIHDIMVVTGHLNQNIEKELNEKVKTVFNDRYSEGMFSSIKKGVASLSKETDAFFVLPVDIPSVKPFTIKKMMDRYEETKDGILFPTFHDEKGHPTLMAYSLAEEILNSNPTGGLRDILKLHTDKWIYERVADRGILLDMDTKEDVASLIEHMSFLPCPDYEECMEMLHLCHVKQETIMHMKRVGDFAKKLSLFMNEKGYHIDLNKVYAGALLHDIAKGNHSHAEVGANIVRDFGYSSMSEIIGEHMELKKIDAIGEKEIVYLCDKLIKGTELTTLEERFQNAFEKYENMPEILKNVKKKYSDAKFIKEIIEKVLGESLENLR